MMNNMSFRSKLLVTILPVVLLGVLAIAAGGYYSASRIIMDTQTNDLTLLTKQIRSEMTEWMDNCRQDAVLLARLHDIHRACLGSDQKDAQSALDQYQENMPYYEALWLANPEGTIVMDSIAGQAIGMEVGAMPGFEKNIAGAREKRMVLSSVDRSPANGLPVVLLTCPVESEGRLIGIMGLSINLDYFSKKFLSRIKIGEHGYVWMTGRNGMVLAHPETANILKLDVSRYEFGRKILKEETGHLFYEWEGLDKIAFFDTDPETGWTVVAAPVPDDFLRPLKQLRLKLALVGLAVLVMAGLVVCFFSNVLAGSIKRVVEMLDRMAEGDLSQRVGIERRDEIGRMYQALDATSERLESRVRLAQDISAGDISQEVETASDRDHLGLALKNMVAGLGNMLEAVNMVAEQIASESRQIAESSQVLSQGASEQAASLEQITGSVTEIESQTRQNADNASLVTREVQAVHAWAENGSGEMKSLVTAMGEIDNSANHVSAIIKTIDDIAFQTNLLALNAAVEAARAGKHGKGFAVVAGEVKNLAQKSAGAAKQTEDLIRDVIGKVETGGLAVDRTAEALKEIVAGVAKVASLVEEISTASLDQSRGIEEVSKGLGLVEQVIHQNTANAEQGAAAAEELSGQARELMLLLDGFKLKENGKTRPTEHFQAEQIGVDPDNHNVSSDDYTALEALEAISYDRDRSLDH